MTIVKLPLLRLAFIAMLGSPFIAGSAAAQNPGRVSARQLSDTYEPQIEKLVAGKALLDAIKSVVAYEQAVLALYPAPTFELGLLQNRAHHLSLHSSFDGWTQDSLKRKEVASKLPPGMGFEFLLALKGRSDADSLLLISSDLAKLKRGFGAKDDKPSDAFTDQELLLGAQLVARRLGAVKAKEFKSVAGRHTLILLVQGPFGQAPSTVVTFGAEGTMYVFVLTTSSETKTDNESKLYETIKTLDLKFMPANSRIITDLRDKGAGELSIPGALHYVRALAGAGEYAAASDELSRIRVLIAELMPKPVVEGNVATSSTYGISLQNPDPEKWKLSVSSDGGVTMFLLEDRSSVTPSAVMMLVVNSVQAYGPQFAEMIGNSKDEEIQKELLASAGRGGLLKMGSELESERFRKFKGMFAYEGIAKGGVENTKAKVICVANADYTLIVLHFVEARRFETKAAELEGLVDKNLAIRPK